MVGVLGASRSGVAAVTTCALGVAACGGTVPSPTALPPEKRPVQFAGATANGMATKTVIVRNDSAARETITALEVADERGGDVLVTDRGTCVVGKPLDPGETCTVVMGFRPDSPGTATMPTSPRGAATLIVERKRAVQPKPSPPPTTTTTTTTTDTTPTTTVPDGSTTTNPAPGTTTAAG